MFCVTRIQILRSIGILVNKHAIDQTYQDMNRGNNTVFPNLDIRKVVETLNKDGLFLGVNLPSDILQEILIFSLPIEYYANNNPNLQFFLVDKEKSELKYQQNFVMATHVHRSIVCPAIQRLENDPILREIAARYLETNPIFIDSRIRWTFPVNDSLHEAVRGFFNFHYDLEDYRFVKFMFYLTDVFESDGNHVVVKGSHKRKRLRDQFSLTRDAIDQDILNYYGQDHVESIYGKAGCGFVEDFYCFHQATLPISSSRLILEMTFSMNRYSSTFKPKRRFEK
ncbi:MAG: hypothetical protein HC790_11950 [Acaryochloridaceae cyanobacterium CSU_3_4]|nr:hypothetical protein [Acaryochloridaceae cyanobacterium CSU_3_4]